MPYPHADDDVGIGAVLWDEGVEVRIIKVWCRRIHTEGMWRDLRCWLYSPQQAETPPGSENPGTPAQVRRPA